jgi:hypothetical protein
MRALGVLIALSLMIPAGMMGGGVQSAHAASGVTLLAEYRFEYANRPHFVDLQGGSTLTPLGPTDDGHRRCNNPTGTHFNADDSWTWSAAGCGKGGGFVIDVDQDISSGYTIAVRFKYNVTGPGWRKIIDFKDKVDDTGFYFNSGHIKFYDHSEQGSTQWGAAGGGRAQDTAGFFL